MTTQQQTDQPADLGERVAQVEGGFAELSNRVGTLQNSVDSLRAETHADNAALRAEVRADNAALREEMQAGFAELRALIEARDAAAQAREAALREEMRARDAAQREETNRFKNQVTFFILGSWAAGVTTIGAALIATGGLG